MVDTARLNEALDPLDLFGGQANRLASDLQAELAELGLELERDFFQQLREDEAPVRDVRNQALAFLQAIESGDAQLSADPNLQFRESQVLEQIGKSAAAQGKFGAGGTRLAEQDALAQLTQQDTQSQLNRLLNLSGFQTQDLLGSNALIAQNTDSQANQLANINAINQAGSLGQSNAIFNVLNQGSRLAGSIFPQGAT
jgi:hypothetical protein